MDPKNLEKLFVFLIFENVAFFVFEALAHLFCRAKAMSAVLWLHGLGDTGNGWRGSFSKVSRKLPDVKFHHPTAPCQPLSLDHGQKTTSWFDLVGWPVGLSEPENPTGIEQTVKHLHTTLEEIEKEGVPSERIIIGGFSQGGAASILAGLTYPKRLGGIISISGWVICRESLESKVHPANANLPCFFSCGTRDSVVDFKLTEKSGEMLKSILGENGIVTHVTRSVHQPDMTELDNAMAFMMKCLS